MQSRVRFAFTLLAGFGAIAIAVLLVWWIASTTATFLLQLKSDVAVAIVAASIAGVVSVVSLAVSKAYESRLAVNQDLRAKKTPVYESIVKTMFRVMLGEKSGKKPLTEGELAQWFVETTETLTIWGSADLVLAFGDFKTGTSSGAGAESLYRFEALLREIRRDLGHRDKKLIRGSILRLWVNDMDEITSGRKRLGEHSNT